MRNRKVQTGKLPGLFIGHGSPMNGIEDNEFTAQWERLGKEISKPNSVLCISAHWLTKGTHITAMPNPRTIHDFGGFPPELYQVNYPAAGSPELAAYSKKLIQTTSLGLDHEWGLDHGTWTVVRRMFPDADIPVLQLSIDYTKPPAYHYELAKEIAKLRQQGVLIIGSGNMVHNLSRVAWSRRDEPNFGFDWALELNEIFKQHIQEGNHKSLIKYECLHKDVKLAIPSLDHYLPLLYILALKEEKEEVLFFNDKAVMGSLTMTSVQIG